MEMKQIKELRIFLLNFKINIILTILFTLFVFKII